MENETKNDMLWKFSFPVNGVDFFSSFTYLCGTVILITLQFQLSWDVGVNPTYRVLRS